MSDERLTVVFGARVGELIAGVAKAKEAIEASKAAVSSLAGFKTALNRALRRFTLSCVPRLQDYLKRFTIMGNYVTLTCRSPIETSPASPIEVSRSSVCLRLVEVAWDDGDHDEPQRADPPSGVNRCCRRTPIGRRRDRADR